jgi:hypothetical protein
MGRLMPLLSAAGQAEVVGADCLLLQGAGLVTWDDLFTDAGEVLEFDQVVHRRGLTYAQLLAASVSESTAGRAAPSR